MKKSKFFLGLVHNPVYNKFNEIVTTSITNLDVHDISRSCLTFGVENYFLINRLESQQELYRKINKFWQSEIALKYNSDRVEALSIIRYALTIDEAIKKIEIQEKVCPLVVSTTAVKMNDQIEFGLLKSIINENEKPVLLLFGTGNGLTNEVHDKADFVLMPIYGESNYNHLSVRSAVAIILDRLISEK